MNRRLRISAVLLIFAIMSLGLIGCDGSSGEVIVVTDDGGFFYEPAVIENDSFDNIWLDSALFGDIFLPPGSAVELDVGPDVDQILVFINGVFFDEIFLASGDIVIFD